MVAHNMVTTQFELDGYRVTRTLGVVRGITGFGGFFDKRFRQFTLVLLLAGSAFIMLA